MGFHLASVTHFILRNKDILFLEIRAEPYKALSSAGKSTLLIAGPSF